MTEFPPVVYVDLKYSRVRGMFRRPQRWSWSAKNANNNRVLARSSESYTNRGDCLNAITQLFSAGTTVYLRQAEVGNQALRMAVAPL